MHIKRGEHLPRKPSQPGTWDEVKIVHPHAAGLDIGGAEIWAAVMPASSAEAETAALRAYLRHRAALIEHRAAHIQHMHKALSQMDLHLTQAVKDTTGVTGMAILRAIVAGERDPHKLAALRQPGVKQHEAEIAKALTATTAPSMSLPSSRPWHCTTPTPNNCRSAMARSNGSSAT